MTVQSSDEITQLLLAWSDGDQKAFEQLSPLIHGELRRLAHRYLGGERPDHSLQTTELINEAFLRLIQWQNVDWKNRAHFFGLAAKEHAKNKLEQLAAAQLPLASASGGELDKKPA